MISMQEKVALVVGGNSGLGKASAVALAEAGARVVVAARREAEGHAVVEELRGLGAEAAFVAVDVREEAQLEALVAATVERFGRLDVAVNSAGINIDFALVGDIDADLLDLTWAVNLRGTVLGMKHQIRQFLRQGSPGAIVNMSSILGLVSAPNGASYAATKHAVIGVTRTAALGYAKHNIRVNCVAPTAIAGTPIVDAALASNPELMEPYIRDIPMGRPGRADEVGRAVAWLCSDAASFVTGHVLALDGGQLAK